MVIEYEVKSVYGNELIYPTCIIDNEGIAIGREHLLALTNSRTLTSGHIKALKALGYTFKRVTMEVI